MQRRTSEQWRDLFAEQAASGLSQAAFCKSNKLCTKYFSLRKRQLGATSPDKATAFVPVKKQAFVAVADKVMVHYHGLELHLPLTPSGAEFLKALA